MYPFLVKLTKPIETRQGQGSELCRKYNPETKLNNEPSVRWNNCFNFGCVSPPTIDEYDECVSEKTQNFETPKNVLITSSCSDKKYPLNSSLGSSNYLKRTLSNPQLHSCGNGDIPGKVEWKRKVGGIPVTYSGLQPPSVYFYNDIIAKIGEINRNQDFFPESRFNLFLENRMFDLMINANFFDPDQYSIDKDNYVKIQAMLGILVCYTFLFDDVWEKQVVDSDPANIQKTINEMVKMLEILGPQKKPEDSEVENKGLVLAMKILEWFRSECDNLSKIHNTETKSQELYKNSLLEAQQTFLSEYSSIYEYHSPDSTPEVKKIARKRDIGYYPMVPVFNIAVVSVGLGPHLSSQVSSDQAIKIDTFKKTLLELENKAIILQNELIWPRDWDEAIGKDKTTEFINSNFQEQKYKQLSDEWRSNLERINNVVTQNMEKHNHSLNEAIIYINNKLDNAINNIIKEYQKMQNMFKNEKIPLDVTSGYFWAVTSSPQWHGITARYNE